MENIILKDQFIASPAIYSNEIEVISKYEMDANKRVICNIKIITSGEPIYKELTLWEGADYDKIGQWTDGDVENRIIEILTGSKPN